ncbi:MAG: methyltransferase domain-containing protein [Clostridia bacterium]|nr:methyltransferase domain-containing protein [Clostridia bacterium]
MEFRRVFDTIPEQFDRYRPRYSPELFEFLVQYAKIGPGKRVLEIGPGTGQATDPILQTQCDYLAIELGEHLCAKMKEKYDRFSNFHIVNDDFITYDFGQQRFDMVYSAATIQWIPEEIAFSKTFELLKPGGVLAMMLTRSDYRTPNEELYAKIQRLYDQYFKPDIPYTHGGFKYDNAPRYGFADFERRDFRGRREMNPDEYVSFCGTHCDHIVIPEPLRTVFFESLRKTVAENGGKVIFEDTYVLYLARKPFARADNAGITAVR